jgi:hypothetical protein
MGEVAPPAPPPPSRELAELPLVETGAGSDLFLTLVRADGTRLLVILGGAECSAITADLLQAARIRCGRAGWPGKVAQRRCSRYELPYGASQVRLQPELGLRGTGG